MDFEEEFSKEDAGLLEFPSLVDRAHALRSLHLGGNEIVQIPPEIELFTALTSLDLSRNEIAQLPAQIRSLASLTDLSLDDNNLSLLPQELGNLTSLMVLTVDDNELAELPKSIKNLVRLEELSVCGNRLSCLPNAIGDLPLTHLSVLFNEISEVPSAFSKLTKLEHLDVGCNPLGALPDAVFSLPSLKRLLLDDSGISELPPRISELTSLEELSLCKNQISWLPRELGQLSLQVLLLDDNPLKDPFSFVYTQETVAVFLAFVLDRLSDDSSVEGTDRDGAVEGTDRDGAGKDADEDGAGKDADEDAASGGSLTGGGDMVVQKEEVEAEAQEAEEKGTDQHGNTDANARPHYVVASGRMEYSLGSRALRVIPPAVFEVPPPVLFLDVHSNMITEIPKEIGTLVNLESLDVSGNQLTVIPPEIRLLESLFELSLNDNKLVAVPQEIGYLTGLQVLSLDDNQLTRLPKEIGNLVSLQELGVNNNMLTALPETIGELHQLTHLSALFNGITALPKSAPQLRRLSHLEIGNNPLNGVPDEIYRLSALKRLLLDNSNISEISPQIGNLSLLEEVSLCTNNIASLPSEFNKLRALKVLLLDGNPVEAMFGKRRSPSTAADVKKTMPGECTTSPRPATAASATRPVTAPPSRESAKVEGTGPPHLERTRGKARAQSAAPRRAASASPTRPRKQFWDTSPLPQQRPQSCLTLYSPEARGPTSPLSTLKLGDARGKGWDSGISRELGICNGRKHRIGEAFGDPMRVMVRDRSPIDVYSSGGDSLRQHHINKRRRALSLSAASQAKGGAPTRTVASKVAYLRPKPAKRRSLSAAPSRSKRSPESVRPYTAGPSTIAVEGDTVLADRPRKTTARTTGRIDMVRHSRPKSSPVFTGQRGSPEIDFKQAVLKNQAQAVEKALLLNPDLSQAAVSGGSPVVKKDGVTFISGTYLHLALIAGSVDVVDLLTKSGACWRENGKWQIAAHGTQQVITGSADELADLLEEIR